MTDSSQSVHTVTLGTTGPWVVMLHGWGQNLLALQPLGEILATTNKVLLVDLPGFGKTPLPAGAANEGGGWDTGQYADLVWSVLQGRGITEPVLLGHSFGGRISVRLAARYPKQVRGLVLVASHGLKRDRTAYENFRIKAIGYLGKAAKTVDAIFRTSVFASRFAPRFGSADYKAAGDLRKTIVKTVNEDLAPLAKTISAPTLLLWGDRDPQTPLDIARNFKRLIHDSTLKILRGKDHEPFKDVGSHLLAYHLFPFLDRLRTSGHA